MTDRLRPISVLLAVLVLSVFSASAQSATITTAQSGNWEAGTTWVGGVAPGASDDAVIAAGHTVTVPVNAAAASILLADNTTGTNGITISAGISLTVGGAITMTAPTAGTSTISVGAGILSAGSITIPGSATAGRNCVVSLSSGSITVAGSITFTGTAAQAQLICTDVGWINIGGNLENGGTLTTSGTGTINFNGSGAQTIGTYTTYNHVAVNNSAGGVTLTGTTTIGGTLTVTAGTLTIGPYTLTVTGATNVSGRVAVTSTTGTKTFTGDVTINSSGTWDNSAGNEAIDLAGSLRNDGTLSAGIGVYTFSGAAKTISGTNIVSIPNLTINGTVTNNGTLAVGTTLAGTGTLTNGTNATLNLGGTISVTTLTSTANPNTVNYNGGAQTLRATTYYHLTMSGTGVKTLTNVGTINGNLTLSGTCSATTAIATTVGGSLVVGSGTTFTNGAFNLTVTGTTQVAGTLAHSSATGTKSYGGLVTIDATGSWTNAGNSAITLLGGLTYNGSSFSAGTGVYTFSTNAQTLSGSGSLTIGSVTVTGITLTNNLASFTVSTALAGTGALVQGSGAGLNLGGTSAITTLDAIASPNTVNFNGAVQTVNATTYHHLTLSGSAAKTLTNVSTINGNLTLSGTCTAATAITTTIGGNLIVGTGTTMTVAGFGLTVTGTTSVTGTLAHSASGGTKTYRGLVTIESGGAWSNAGNSGITFTGGLTHNGTSFSAGTGQYTFNANAQTLDGSGALAISNVTVTGITLTNNLASLSVGTSLSGTGTFRQGVGAYLSAGGTVTTDGFDASAAPNSIYYSGAAQTVKSATYHHLLLGGTGAKTLPASTLTIGGDLTLTGTVTATAAASVRVTGSLTIGAGTTFDAGAYAHDLKGSFSNSGTFTGIGSTMMFTGTSDQSVGGTTATTFADLTINKNAGALTVGTSLSVSGTLSLVKGNINAGANLVTITSTGSVARISGHVIGDLRKYVSAGSPAPTMEVGDATSYCPIDLSFAGVTSGGYLTARVTDGDHPNIATSEVDPTYDVNKYWTLSNNGIAFTSYSPTFNFNGGDIDAGASSALFKVGRYSGGLWTDPVVGTRNATATQALGLTAFGDFSVGQESPDPPVLAAIAAQTVDEGDTLVVAISGSDPDGDSLILTAIDLQTNATLIDSGNGSGSLVFCPSYVQAGVYTVSVIASDGALADSETVTITVTDVDVNPILAAIDSQVVAEDDTLVIVVHATDPGGDSLVLSAVNLPANASFADSGDGSGSLVFTPNFAQAGQYAITVIASDGTLADSELVSINVTNLDRAPVLAAIDSQTVAEGDTLIVAVAATDPDGDSLILTAGNLPANASFADHGDGTGTLEFCPSFSQSGEYSVTIVVSDSLLVDSQIVIVTVTGTNRAPLLAAIDSQLVTEGDTLIFDLSASDPDNDSLTFSASELPAHATLTDFGDGAGRVEFAPTVAQIGTHVVTLFVSDGALVDSQTVSITVVARDSLVISGNAGMDSVVLCYTVDSALCVTADSAGFYAITVPNGWSGTVTPTRTGYGFTPSERTYTSIGTDQTGQDFVPQIISDAGSDPDLLIPAEFSLSQNYPNPFNPTTTIEYGLPTRSHVRIEVFNTLGQPVRLLLDRDISAGSYRVNWDGRDDGGSMVCSGVYLYRISADSFVESRKMVLLK